MMILVLFIIGAAVVFSAFVYCLQRMLFRGELQYMLYFLCLYLPFYLTIQILGFSVTASPLVVSVFKYLKEFIVFTGIISWCVYRKNLLDYPWRFFKMDNLFLIFLSFCLVYTVAPIGPATLVNKLIYFKNILILGLMYFLGRNMTLTYRDRNLLLNGVLLLFLFAFGLNLIEKAFDTHFQSWIGYPNFMRAIEDNEPVGEFGLSWTFGAHTGDKRFAAFFSNPLELAIASVLGILISVAMFLECRRNSLRRLVYVISGALALACLLFAYSRAALGALFVTSLFIAVIFGYYRFIYLSFFGVLVFFGGIFLFGSDDLRFFVIDTLNFSEPSSVGHVIEWLEGIQSIAENRMGLGLATSGNSGGVDRELQIGGENQFIIYGVQLGLIGLILYIALVIASIRQPLLAYRMLRERGEDTRIAFIAATFKFAFLFSLMTANAESYGFVVYLSWWMVGYSVQMRSRFMDSNNQSHIPLIPKLA